MASDVMRPRKGDIYIVLNDGANTIRTRIEREFVDQADRDGVGEMMAALSEFLVARRHRRAQLKAADSVSETTAPSETPNG